MELIVESTAIMLARPAMNNLSQTGPVPPGRSAAIAAEMPAKAMLTSTIPGYTLGVEADGTDSEG
jgi:hypothetical protein